MHFYPGIVKIYTTIHGGFTGPSLIQGPISLGATADAIRAEWKPGALNDDDGQPD